MNKTHDLDKSKWPDGPWKDEPDRVDWVYNGFSCMMIRNTHGNWCGYVGVPNNHSCYKKNYDDVNVDVHGGLTYSAKCSEGGIICHVPEPGMPDDVWWLGFDCGHYMDFAPGIAALGMEKGFSGFGVDDGEYRDVEYVKSEVRKLADQLKDM